jgi:hypothetical protein
MRKRLLQLLTLVGAALGLALANASDDETFTVTVSGTESVQIDTGGAPLTVDYSNTTYCSAVDRFCAWYPTVIYSTNYGTNRKLVARATTNSPILCVVLEKQGPPYDNPFTPPWNPSGSTPGTWAFSGSTLTLSATDQNVVVGIQNGYYAIAPKLKLVFSSSPAAGSYQATVTFTIMAQ